jgi:phosphoribosyl 1,2-cyclic phosphodiesterase
LFWETRRYAGQLGEFLLKFCVLASGSSGNSSIVATSRTRLLVDAGLGVRDLMQRMAAAGECLETLDAVLITHEHSDHIAGLCRLLRNIFRKHKRKIPVYVTWRTEPMVDWENCEPAIERFQAGSSFMIGDIAVDSFTIPHDAVDPVGFTFRAGGIKIGIATDLGYIPDSIKYHLRSTDVLLLESNHDVEMLKVGPYPWSVKQRVMGRNGHLSNDVVSDFLASDLASGTGYLILGHLSEHNNHPELVRMSAAGALQRRGLSPRLVIAEQNTPSEVFTF